MIVIPFESTLKAVSNGTTIIKIRKMNTTKRTMQIDQIKSDNNKELFLESAPESDENFFLVPKVVD